MVAVSRREVRDARRLVCGADLSVFNDNRVDGWIERRRPLEAQRRPLIALTIDRRDGLDREVRDRGCEDGARDATENRYARAFICSAPGVDVAVDLGEFESDSTGG